MTSGMREVMKRIRLVLFGLASLLGVSCAEPFEDPAVVPTSMIDLLVSDYDPPGRLVDTVAHEHVAGAIVRSYEVPDGQLLLTEWQGVVHEIIFQTPGDHPADSQRRNQALFAHYGDGHQWNEILDNGFGKVYRRADMQRYAKWSYAMDITTIGTMAFHEAEQR
jgi:hypothetical protein